MLPAEQLGEQLAEPLDEFRETREGVEIDELLASARSSSQGRVTKHDSQQMITIRIPATMHRALIEESERLDLPLNSLAITKLLRPTDARFSPIEPGPRRGRRPQLR